MIPLTLFTTSIICNAIGDGFNDSDKKLLGHFFRACSVLCLLIVVFLSKQYSWLLLPFYAMLRFSIFDITYNLFRRLPINYVGSSSFYDKLLKNLNIGIFERIIVLIVSMSLYFNYVQL
jgi:hypothetical protein